MTGARDEMAGARDEMTDAKDEITSIQGHHAATENSEFEADKRLKGLLTMPLSC